MKERIEELRKIAMANYNQGGDGMVECWTNEDYEDFIKKAEARGEDVVQEFYASMKIYQDHREDIQGA